MNSMYFLILVGILGIIFGFVLVVYLTTRPVIIRFEYFPLNWLLVILLTFLSVILAFYIEFRISRIICDQIVEIGSIAFITQRLVENGIGIPVFCLAISYIFNRLVESQSFHYLPQYNSLVPKIVFFSIIIMFSVALLSESQDYIKSDFLNNRVCMWIIAAFGIWIGFKFISPINNERDERDSIIIQIRNQMEGIWEKVIYRHDGIVRRILMNFWSPIITSIFLCVVLTFMSFNLKEQAFLNQAIVLFTVFFVPSGIFTSFCYRSKINPNEKQSKKNLENAWKELENGGEGQYGRVKYKIEKRKDKDGEKIWLNIFAVKVRYDECPDRKKFNELFGEKIELIMDQEDALHKLKERDNSRKEYIQNGFDYCREQARKRKLSQNHKEKKNEF